MTQRTVRRLLAVASRVALLALFTAGSAGAQPPLIDEFDHMRTGFPLTGAHERVRCESCHLRGQFQGTPTSCDTCHAVGSLWDAGGRPANHIPSSNRCGDCHVTTSWSVARFDHAGITNGCFGCHNGQTATGKPGNHIPSSNDCEVCHRTLSWTPAGFDHTGITTGCFSCHNGQTATGKPNNHIPSGNDCETCHTTNNWRADFDHDAITSGCFGCHNGQSARGKPRDHPPSGNDCETCHTTRNWD